MSILTKTGERANPPPGRSTTVRYRAPSAAVKLPRLIVNGDDFGRSESNSRGIIEAYRRGIVTSTSIVANGPAFDLATRLAKENPGLGVGIHLVLQEYKPVVDPREIRTLVRDDGSFHPIGTSFGKILLRLTSLSDVRKEWEAQVRRVLDEGIRPTHLDGHRHCHAHPSLAGLLIEVATKFHVPAVRLPSETLRHLGRASGFSSRRYLEKTLLHCLCWSTRATWARRLHFPDAFFGFMEGGRMNFRSLDVIVALLRAGVSELMVHPGISNDDTPFCSGYDWKGDLETLTKYTKEDFESRFGVRLVSYREAWT